MALFLRHLSGFPPVRDTRLTFLPPFFSLLACFCMLFPFFPFFFRVGLVRERKVDTWNFVFGALYILSHAIPEFGPTNGPLILIFFFSLLGDLVVPCPLVLGSMSTTLMDQ